MGFFNKIKNAVKKTRDHFLNKFDALLSSFKKIDENLMEELEEILITSDIGVETSQKICNLIKEKIKKSNTKDVSEIKDYLKEIINNMLEGENSLNISTVPSIILVLGVNGVGKTTTIGKLAAMFNTQGKKVVLAAADTFRAAATEQLEIWSKRSSAEIVKGPDGGDPASVVFEAIRIAKSKKSDVIICDTAGRLHNKKNLMDELGKIQRIIKREMIGCDIENLLVLDASTGQNALQQATEFKKIIDLTGLVLAKLDGTAKGGIILAIKEKLGIPIKFVGTGETIDSLQLFDAKSFTDAIFEC